MRHLTSCLLVLAFVAVAIAPSIAQGPPAGGQGAGAPAARGQGPGRAGGGGRGRGMDPSKIRSVPAETTAAKYSNPGWKAPRTPWGDPDLQGEFSSDDMR